MQEQNNPGQAQPAQNVTVNNAAPKSSKGAVIALTAIIALLVGGGGTFAAMKLIDTGDNKTNCAENSSASNNGNDGSTSPEGAPNAEDQKYAEDRNAYQALRLYIDRSFSISPDMAYVELLFPGAKNERISSERSGDVLLETYKYSSVSYDDFMAKAKASFAENVIKSSPSLESDQYSYENCDGALCIKAHGGRGGIAMMYTIRYNTFEKKSDGVYEIKVYKQDDTTSTYHAEFDSAGVMTSISKTED